eukprot:10670_4
MRACRSSWTRSTGTIRVQCSKWQTTTSTPCSCATMFCSKKTRASKSISTGTRCKTKSCPSSIVVRQKQKRHTKVKRPMTPRSLNRLKHAKMKRKSITRSASFSKRKTRSWKTARGFNVNLTSFAPQYLPIMFTKQYHDCAPNRKTSLVQHLKKSALKQITSQSCKVNFYHPRQTSGSRST